MIIKCPKCGTEIMNEVSFCPKCGCRINYLYLINKSAEEVCNPQTAMRQPMANVHQSKSNLNMNVVGIVGSVVYGCTIFVPLASVNIIGVSRNLIDGGTDWIIVLAIALITLILSIIGNKTADIINIIIGILAAFIGIIELKSVQDIIYNDEYGMFVSTGIGIYAMLIGAVAIICGSVINLYIKK